MLLMNTNSLDKIIMNNQMTESKDDHLQEFDTKLYV
jgi:hypothetical protein